MKTTISKINEITRLCFNNNFTVDYAGHVGMLSVYHMDDKFNHLFYMQSFVKGNLINHRSDSVFKIVPIDELLTELKTYIKTLK